MGDLDHACTEGECVAIFQDPVGLQGVSGCSPIVPEARLTYAWVCTALVLFAPVLFAAQFLTHPSLRDDIDSLIRTVF
jgi:hypothetical protein